MIALVFFDPFYRTTVFVSLNLNQQHIILSDFDFGFEQSFYVCKSKVGEDLALLSR